MIFDITINKKADPVTDLADVSNCIHRLFPQLRCYSAKEMLADDANPDLKVPYTWFDILETPDTKDWASVIRFQYFPEMESIGPFAPIQITEQIGKQFNCDCLCDGEWLNSLISNMDATDPYTTLAFINGKWFFAETAGMKLTGSYFNEEAEITSDEAIQLFSQLDLSTPTCNMYNYFDLIQTTKKNKQ